jgi:hypothetical protein
MALWDLSDQKKLRKLKEWVYLVIDNSCLRNPKLQDLVDLDAWVERIASHGRPTFDRIQAAADLAREINQEFISLGYDADDYFAKAEYFLSLKIQIQNHEAENDQRVRLYGKATKLPFAHPRDVAAKIGEVLGVRVPEQESDEEVANHDRTERYALIQRCPVCQKDVETDEVVVYINDWTVEHQLAIARYSDWAKTTLYGEGFVIFTTGIELHEHLVPDVRRVLASLLDCVSLVSFREISEVGELVDVFVENGIELHEIEDTDYSNRDLSGSTTWYGVIEDSSVNDEDFDYIVGFKLWNGYEQHNAATLAELSEMEFSFQATGLSVWFDCMEGYKPSDAELAKWSAVKGELAP